MRMQHAAGTRVLGLALSAFALVTRLVTMRVCLCYRATLYA